MNANISINVCKTLFFESIIQVYVHILFNSQGISVSCTSWPNSANNGCTSDGDDWTPLDKTTFGKDECESLCRKHASSDGCCFVGEEFGCYWKGRATASQDPNDKNFAVTCTASGELY